MEEGLNSKRCLNTHPSLPQAELKPLFRKHALLSKERDGIKGRLLSVAEVKKFSEIDRLEEQVGREGEREGGRGGEMGSVEEGQWTGRISYGGGDEGRTERGKETTEQ